jgi:organic radical activating enzyme
VSVSGEIGLIPQGQWTTFVRLAGCNLRCPFCDTAKTQVFSSGVEMSVDEVVQRIVAAGPRHVLITGGEPLLQMGEVAEVCIRLRDLSPRSKHKTIQIETNGTIAPDDELSRFVDCFVFDLKPRSIVGEDFFPAALVDWFCRAPGWMSVWVKAIVQDRADYDRAVQAYSEGRPCERAVIRWAMSAVEPLPHSELFGWLREEKRFAIAVNCQLHKAIGVAGIESQA